MSDPSAGGSKNGSSGAGGRQSPAVALRVRLDGRREGRDRIYLFAQIQRVLEINELRIAALYDALAQVAPSPVVELNRAVAVSMAFGPAAGLELVDALTDEPSLEGYHLLPSVRGDLLTRLGRFDEARRELERAASLTRNERERTLLLERARGVAEPVELRTDLA